MAAKKPKRLNKYLREVMTPEQLLDRRRAQERARQKKHRALTTKVQKRVRRIAETTRCYDWDVVMPHVRKEPDGCWIWTGPYAGRGGKPQPIVNVGAMGRERANVVILCLSRKKPIPYGCSVTTSCGRIECVAPKHLVITNQVVERAKNRKVSHE